MSEIKSVLLQINEEKHIAIITLNRPQFLNAINTQLEKELLDVLIQVRNDSNIRVVVLTGAGKSFCSGADIRPKSTPTNLSLEGNQTYARLMGKLWPILEQIVGMEKPIIAAINGTAAGAGCSLALACDLRIMGQDANLLQAFSNIGLVPDMGSSWFLVKNIGYSRAYEIAIEGKRIDSNRCLQLGLTNRIVPNNQLLKEAETWALQLAERPALALGFTKKIMLATQTSTLLETVELESKMQRICVGSPDQQEGIKAFLEKRKPKFNQLSYDFKAKL